MSKEPNRAKLIDRPIKELLWVKSLPMLAGISGMIVFNLVDAIFLGQLGKNELAAIGIIMPVIMILNGLSFGIGHGVSAVLSRVIGAGDESEIKRLTTDSLVLAVILTGIFVIAGFFTMGALFPLYGAEGEVFELVKEYMSVWYAGAVFVVIPMVGNNAIRATGDTMTTSIIMLVAVGVNLILDPLLIFGIGPFPRMEMQGAALATVIARGASFLLAFWVLFFRDKMITLAKPKLKNVLNSWKRILYIGIPQSANYIILPISIGIITKFVSEYGEAAIASVTGVALRIDFLALGAIMALGAALGPIVGQNLGAEKFGRVMQAIKYSFVFSIIWGAAAAVIFAILGEPIGSLFNDNPKVIGTTTLYLLIVPASYGMIGILMLSSVILNVLNKPLYATALTFMRALLFYVPFTYIGSELFGLTGLIAGIAIANLICGAISYYVVMKTANSEINKSLSSESSPQAGLSHSK